jgi:hypothetical protein
MNMKRNEAFPGKYLKQEDVDPPVLAIIDKAIRDEVSDGESKETKTILFFSNEIKPMILNGENWDTIAALYGDESDAWTGKQIEVYRKADVRFGNKITGGVRVRATNGHSAAQSPIDKLTAIRKELSEHYPDKLPTKASLGVMLDSESVEKQIVRHQQILDAAKAEAMP